MYITCNYKETGAETIRITSCIEGLNLGLLANTIRASGREGDLNRAQATLASLRL